MNYYFFFFLGVKVYPLFCWKETNEAICKVMNLLRTKFSLIPHASRMCHSLDWPMPQVTYRHGSFDQIAHSTSTFRVCLVGVKIGRMKNKERKIW